MAAVLDDESLHQPMHLLHEILKLKTAAYRQDVSSVSHAVLSWT